MTISPSGSTAGSGFVDIVDVGLAHISISMFSSSSGSSSSTIGMVNTRSSRPSPSQRAQVLESLTPR